MRGLYVEKVEGSEDGGWDGRRPAVARYLQLCQWEEEKERQRTPSVVNSCSRAR